MKLNIIRNIKGQFQLIKNFSFLAIFEFINLAFPLIITPLIIKIIGLSNYGKVSFLQAILLSLCVITDWGFNISAIREVSSNKKDLNVLSEIIANIFYSKLLLLFVVFILFLIISSISHSFYFFLISFLLIIAKTIYPNWIFMGLEKNQYLIFSSIGSNLLYLIFVLIYINNQNDYIYILFLQGLSMLVVYILLLFIAIKKFKFNLELPKKDVLIAEIKQNYPIFLSNASLTISAYASTIILKFFITDFALGIFSLAQKISSITKLGLTIFSSAIYPRISIAILDKSQQKLKALIKHIYIPYSFIFIFCSLFSLIFINPIVLYFDSNATKEHILVVSILMLIPIITLFNLIPYLLLLSHKLDKVYSKIMINSALISILSLFLLVPFLNIYGAILSMIIVEIYIVINLFFKAKSFYPKFNL